MLTRRAARRCTIAVAVVVPAAAGGGLALLALSGRLAVRAVTPAELALTLGLTGSLILWHRPSNRIGLLLALTSALFAVSVLAGGVLEYAGARGGVPGWLSQPALAWAWLTQALALPWALLLLWYPDGRFTSRGWKRFFAAAAVVLLSLAVAGYLLSAPGGRLPALSPAGRAPASAAGPLTAAAWPPFAYLIDGLSLAVPLVALAGLAQRYRRSGPVTRQQVKWLAAAAAVTIAGSAVASAIQDSGGAAHAAASRSTSSSTRCRWRRRPSRSSGTGCGRSTSSSRARSCTPCCGLCCRSSCWSRRWPRVCWPAGRARSRRSGLPCW
jgi:hypothetical protein